MSDIIANAKQLLDGATPAPWELYGGEIHQIQHAPEQCTSFRCDHRWPVLSESWGESAAVAAADEDLALMAAVPELAQALADETYEYQIQTRSQRMPTWLAITDDTLQKWYSEDGYNEIIREGRVFRGGAGFEMRVLRRRVSPPEVINE